MKYLPMVMLFLVAAVAAGCYFDNSQSLYPTNSNNTGACDTSNVTYSTSIVTILNSGGSNSCYSCHSASNYVSLGGNINLDGYANAKIYASNGRLLGAITHGAGYSAMPKNLAQLSDCDIAAVRTWIRQGTANN